MELSEKLVQLGFSKNEATVYIALVELGQCKASDIIKKTGLHRNIVYEALDDLVLKKLAFKTSKGGVALFQLSDAATLVDDVQSKLALAKEVTKHINAAREKSTHEIKLYEGFEGFKSYHESVLNELKNTAGDNELLVLASTQATEQYYDSFFKKFDSKREEANVPARLLGKKSNYIDLLNQTKSTRAKLLSSNITDPVETKIWTDHVAFMLNDIEPFIISIQNKKLAQSFREYFENLWGQDVSVITGIEAMKELFQKKLDALHKGDGYVILAGTYRGIQMTLADFFVELHTKRVKQGVTFRALAFEQDAQSWMDETRAAGDPEMKLTQFRFLSEDFGSPMQINIYPDSIVLVHWGTGKEAVAVDIRRQDIRDSMMKYFEALWQQDVQTYRGVDGLRMIMEKSLDHTENWFIGGNGGITRVMLEYWKEYNRRRIEKGVWWHDLIYQDHVELPGLDYRKPSNRNEAEFFEYKTLPPEMNSPTVIFMYGNTVAHILWDAQIAFVTENTDVFDSYRKYFDYLWGQDTFITNGMANVQELFYQKMRELKEGEEYAVLWGAYGTPATEAALMPWFEQYNTERIKRGVVLKAILYDRIRKQVEHEMTAAGDPERSSTFLRFIKEDYGSPMQINIYPDSVVLFAWNEGDDAVAVEIQKQTVRNAMRAYFDGIWKSLPSV